MKQLYLSVLLILLLGCTKEKTTDSISGTWTIIETSAGTTTGIQIKAYPPSSEITLQFERNGELIISGSNPGLAMSPLWEYNRYEIMPDNIIRFFQTSGRIEKKAFFTLNGELFLNYLQPQSGYEEKFLKIK